MISVLKRRVSACFSKPQAGMLAFALLMLFAPQGKGADALNYFKNYFVTGDYTVAGVGLRGQGVSGFATGTITMNGVPCTAGFPFLLVPCSAPGAVPADIVAAFLYWQTVETSPASAPSAINGFFDGNAIVGKLLGSPTNTPCLDSGQTATSGRVYRADVLRYLPINSTNNVRVANGTHTVKLPDAGHTGFPLTNGASLVVIYRITVPGLPVPLRAVVIYDGAYTASAHTSAMTQTIGGFYQAALLPFAEMTPIVANGQPGGKSETLTVNGQTIAVNPFTGQAGVRWDNPTFDIGLNYNDSSYSTQATVGGSGCLTWGAIVSSTYVSDTDGDGLLDVWETSGLHLNTQTTPATFGTCADAKKLGDPCVNLPAMGANPLKRDIFLEIDWLQGTDGHLHIPKYAALSAIGATFANNGIAMHFDVGANYQGQPYIIPTSADPPVTGYPNGGGEVIPESTLLCPNAETAAANCSFPNLPYSVLGWKIGFDAIKDGFPALGPSYVAHFAHNRKDIFHYVLFGHAIGITSTTPGVPNSTSGVADRPGGDLMITLGLWRADDPAGCVPSVSCTDQTGTAQEQAGTLMHELGHNLGLSHAGLYRLPNCMPGYPSVMNYLYQARGLTDSSGGSHIDYSYGRLPGLNENSLSEINVFGGATPPYQIRYYGPTQNGLGAATLHCDGTPLNRGESLTRLQSPIGPNLDWNNNGKFDTGKLAQDIDYNGFTGSPVNDSVYPTIPASNPLKPWLIDSDDWDNLNLRQIGARLNVAGLSEDIGQTDLGQTDLGQTDLGQTDLGQTDLGQTDLGQTDLGQTDLGQTDLGDVDYETTISTLDATSPSQPLTAASSLTGITLTWGTPTVGQIRSYGIYRSDPNNPTPTLVASVAGAPPATTWTDTITQLTSVGPAPAGGTGAYYNTKYTYFITSVDINGTTSPPSNSVTGIVNHVFITATNQTRQYGTANPALTFTTAGTQDPSVKGTTTCTTTAGLQSPVVAGGYPITCSGLTPTAGVTYTAGTLTITQAPLTATITASNKVYDSTTNAVIATCSLAVVYSWDTGNVTCGGTGTFNSPNVQTATTVTANLTLGGSAGGNYHLTSATPTAAAHITQATASITVTPYNVTYDGTAHTAAATATGVGSVNLIADLMLNTTHTNAGVYSADTWSFTDTAGNYFNVATTTITDTINKANASITVTPYNVPYDGNAHTATATATGVGSVNLIADLMLNTTHTNAGVYSADTWTFMDPNGNYNNVGPVTITDTINKAVALVVLSNLSQAYTGGQLTPTATTTPAVQAITWTPPFEIYPGSYPVTAIVSDPNYTGSASGTFTITIGFTSLALVGSPSGVVPTATSSLLTMTTTTSQTSAAWFPVKLTVGSGFTTQFQFQLLPGTTSTIGDGLAFVIQNGAAGTGALGTTGQGGFIGYQGLLNSLAIEFDTYQDSWDPNSNHVAIQSNGTGANTADHTAGALISVVNPLTPPSTNLSDGSPHVVQITYDGSSTLTVLLDGTQVLSAPVNLSTLLSLDPGGMAVLGFTAATGDASEVTNVLSWSFSSN